MRPTSYIHQRASLQQITAHVLASRLHDATGRFGLRPTPGGWGTPQHSQQRERLRISGELLVREQAGPSNTDTMSLNGSTMADLAAFAGVDLSAEFSVGHDTPELDGVDTALYVSHEAVLRIASWFSLAGQAIDQTVAAHGGASMAQVWPEHFDIGIDVAFGPGETDRVNLGASPGDNLHQDPYLYVGPWTAARPGNDSTYWNAPFGAVLGEATLTLDTDMAGRAVHFFETGMALLKASAR